ncbi:hypothetical protein DMB92_06060 [Campylobacter sp. MIT 99-7217]|uniref:P-loop NTPase fold protein n=1 Tax=Campylobacter sp. MIT 99-7217 TaxID=535091 RepID=UPI00115889C3|nr:P-loop NTPase fold protein [Campylobacter sp. MIT 99-7217]TQR31938.1 hypothetical protein DMB92_06060 [Campylobacter sp. MIT 99-7217]
MENLENENLKTKIERVVELLSAERGICVAIKGSWGVGKSYVWHERIAKELKEDILLKDKENDKSSLKCLIKISFCLKKLVFCPLIKIFLMLRNIVCEFCEFCEFRKDNKKEIITSYEDNKKEIVTISLFGKEHYQQILDEIVLKLYGRKNKILKSFKGISVGGLPLGLLLSSFEKEEFKNIIICFDDIERKSNKLRMKELLGLVAELKERKECSVVLIFNEDELVPEKQDDNKQDNKKERGTDRYNFGSYKEKYVDQDGKKEKENQESDNLIEKEKRIDLEDFKAHKEKSIDYEISIEDNEEVQKLIIEESKLEPKAQNILCKLLPFDENLRALKNMIDTVAYFNEKCELKEYLEDDKFNSVTRALYEAISKDCKSFKDKNYNSKTNENKFGYVLGKYSKNNVLDENNIKNIRAEFQKHDLYTKAEEFRTNCVKLFYETNLNEEEKQELINKNIKLLQKLQKEKSLNLIKGYYSDELILSFLNQHQNNKFEQELREEIMRNFILQEKPLDEKCLLYKLLTKDGDKDLVGQFKEIQEKESKKKHKEKEESKKESLNEYLIKNKVLNTQDILKNIDKLKKYSKEDFMEEFEKKGYFYKLVNDFIGENLNDLSHFDNSLIYTLSNVNSSKIKESNMYQALLEIEKSN